MGASHSTPPPCVEVNPIYAPYGRIQVPTDSGFEIYPPPPKRHVRSRPRPRPRRVRIDFDDFEEEFENESEMVGMMSPRMGRRGGMGGLGIGRGMGMGMGAYPSMAMGSPRMGIPPGMRGGMGSGIGPPGMGGTGGPEGMGGGCGGMGGHPGMGMPPGMGGGSMQPPHGMMGGPPPGMGHMPDLPPRYSSGGVPPGQNPYAYQPGPASSVPGVAERPVRRPRGGDERIPMGAFAKSPKISRSHTSPMTADKIHRTIARESGKEWLKGDDFLDACMCTTNCTCREGHRVIYRSRDDGGESDGDARYGSGEIRYILKKDLGKDCGDHSGCKKDDSEKEEKQSRKEKKKEEKRRKEELKEFKDNMLEALDVKFDELKKAKSSKTGSVSSPRPPFAGLGGPFGLGPLGMGAGDPNAMMNDPVMAQKMAELGMGPVVGMGPPMAMPPNMPMGGVNPYAMGAMGGMQTGLPAGMPGMSKMPPGMIDPRRQMQMQSSQMPMGGMTFEDDLSMEDMEGVGLGNPYFGRGMKGKELQQTRFIDPSSWRDDAKVGRRGGDRDRGRPRRMRPRQQGRTFARDKPDLYHSRRPPADDEDSFDNVHRK
jgi:hypothetical protein